MMEEATFDDYQKGTKQVNAEVPLDLWISAKQNFISFKDAVRFGIQFKLAEKDNGLTFEYPENLLQKRLLNKCEILQKRVLELELELELKKQRDLNKIDTP